jgi:RNA-directed DNA polymerase
LHAHCFRSADLKGITVADSPRKLSKLIVSPNRDDRFRALEGTRFLSPEQATRVLKKGLLHWDRKFRNYCAKELAEHLHGGAASILIPLRAAGRLFASSSTSLLLTNEDEKLIRYLRLTFKRQDAVGELARGLYLLTSHGKPIVARKEESETSEDVPASESPDLTWEWVTSEIPPLGFVSNRIIPFLYGIWIRSGDFSELYRVTSIPKRSGGQRTIEEPAAALKIFQRKFLAEYLNKLSLHAACHGFRKGHSIATNASPHTNKEVVINLDIKDFFPTISSARVYGLFRSVGFEDQALRFVTDACVFRGHLPQGAPTSPMIANLVCRRLDARMAGLAKVMEGDYTRYADDMTFSGSEKIVKYIPLIKSIVEDEGFVVSMPKLRIFRQGSRQDVTGLTVNKMVSVPRAIRRRLRAAIHQFGGNGIAKWKGNEIGLPELLGHINYISSIQPDVGGKFRAELKAK